MNELKTAMAMRGVRPAELAQMAQIKPQQVNNYLNEGKQVGPKVARTFAELLRVSEAYLRGVAQTMAVRDFLTGEMWPCKIIAEEIIEHYGIFYTVDHPEIGPMSVIIADGVQFTTAQWDGARPTKTEEIEWFDWVDANGRATLMLDGLPRLMLGSE